MTTGRLKIWNELENEWEILGPGGNGDSLTYDQWAQYIGNTVTINNAANGFLTWNTLGQGVELLDRSDLDEPLVLTSGIYSVSAEVTVTSVTDDGFFAVILHFDYANNDILVDDESRVASPGQNNLTKAVSLTNYIAAGQSMRVEVNNNDGVAARDFRLINCRVQRLS